MCRCVCKCACACSVYVCMYVVCVVCDREQCVCTVWCDLHCGGQSCVLVHLHSLCPSCCASIRGSILPGLGVKVFCYVICKLRLMHGNCHPTKSLQTWSLLSVCTPPMIASPQESYSCLWWLFHCDSHWKPSFKLLENDARHGSAVFLANKCQDCVDDSTDAFFGDQGRY